jgi:hypothetical protein
VTGAQMPLTRSLRVTSQLSLATRSAGEKEGEELIGSAEAPMARMAARASDLNILRDPERDWEMAKVIRRWLGTKGASRASKVKGLI